jgi:hypothetical protein
VNLVPGLGDLLRIGGRLLPETGRPLSLLVRLKTRKMINLLISRYLSDSDDLFVDPLLLLSPDKKDPGYFVDAAVGLCRGYERLLAGRGRRTRRRKVEVVLKLKRIILLICQWLIAVLLVQGDRLGSRVYTNTISRTKYDFAANRMGIRFSVQKANRASTHNTI